MGTSLWLAYGQDSGRTSSNPISQFGKYLSNKKDSNFDSIVDLIAKSLNVLGNKVIIDNKSHILIEVAVYNPTKGTYDVWGGTEKPKGLVYMVMNKDGVKVINFFKTKSEATSWVKSSS